MQVKTFHFQIAVKEVKDMGNQGVMIQGYASTPDIDRYQDIVEPAAFADALKMFMSNPTLLRSHDPDRPCGNVTQAMITDKGLWVSAMVTEEETKNDVLENRMRAFSIGYIPLESTLQHKDGSPFNAECDSPWDADIVRVIKRLDLVEISITSTPANGFALFTIAKSVKLFFNELVTKSMKINKKEIEKETETEVPEKVETIPASEVPENVETPAEELGEKDKKETEEPVPPAAVETPVPAAEKPKEEAKPTEEEETVEVPEDKTEKGGETPPAENGEAPVGDEPVAEVTPAEKIEETPEGNKAISVNEEMAKSLPFLVEAGFICESKDASALSCPKAIVDMIAKLFDAFKVVAQKNIDLEAKLEKQPDKLALKVTGQFTEEKTPEQKEAEKKSGGPEKKASSEFLSMFGMKND